MLHKLSNFVNAAVLGFFWFMKEGKAKSISLFNGFISFYYLFHKYHKAESLTSVQRVWNAPWGFASTAFNLRNKHLSLKFAFRQSHLPLTRIRQFWKQRTQRRAMLCWMLDTFYLWVQNTALAFAEILAVISLDYTLCVFADLKGVFSTVDVRQVY